MHGNIGNLFLETQFCYYNGTVYAGKHVQQEQRETTCPSAPTPPHKQPNPTQPTPPPRNIFFFAVWGGVGGLSFTTEVVVYIVQFTHKVKICSHLQIRASRELGPQKLWLSRCF